MYSCIIQITQLITGKSYVTIIAWKTNANENEFNCRVQNIHIAFVRILSKKSEIFLCLVPFN